MIFLNIQNTLQPPPVDYRHCWHTNHNAEPAGIKGRASARDHHPRDAPTVTILPIPFAVREVLRFSKVWKTSLHVWSNWDSYAFFIWIPSIYLISCSNQWEKDADPPKESDIILSPALPQALDDAREWGHLCSSQLAPELEKRMVGRREELVTHKCVCAQTQGQQTVRRDLWGSFVVLPFGIRTQHVKQGVSNLHFHSWLFAIQSLIKAPLFPDQWKYATCI